MREPFRLMDECNDSEAKHLIVAAMHNDSAPSTEMKERVEAAVLARFRAERGETRNGMRTRERSGSEQATPEGTDPHVPIHAIKRERTWVTRMFVTLAAAAVLAMVAFVVRFSHVEDAQSRQNPADMHQPLPLSSTKSEPDLDKIHRAVESGNWDGLTPEEKVAADNLRQLLQERLDSGASQRGGVSGRVSDEIIMHAKSIPSDTIPQGAASTIRPQASVQEPPRHLPIKPRIKRQKGIDLAY